jgi:hypothetical protein
MTETTRDGGELSTPELLKKITGEVQLLVKSQVDLAKSELRADLKKESRMVAGLGASAIAALTAVNLLLVTVVLALAKVMPAWGAGLLVSGVVIAAGCVAGLVGWSKRVRRPMARTRGQLERDVTFTKGNLGKGDSRKERTV